MSVDICPAGLGSGKHTPQDLGGETCPAGLGSGKHARRIWKGKHGLVRLG